MGLLDGKAVAVTGAGGGIGRGYALLLAAEGARVLVNDVDGDAAEAVCTEVHTAGGRAVAHPRDIASRAGASSLVDACRREFGAIDALVNNAGNLRDRSFLKMSGEDFDAVWRVHVKGTFWCAQAAARAMKEAGRGGVIINTSSASHFGNFGQTNYAAAKGAIASMSYTWAIELARYGIRVNVVCPVALTRLTAGVMGGAQEPSAAALWPPERNAPLLVYLVSDEAANVSGQAFGIGGERLAYMVRPHYGKTLECEGGWTVAAIRECFQREMPGEFGPLGLLGAPYPFHEGVHPPSGEGESS